MKPKPGPLCIVCGRAEGLARVLDGVRVVCCDECAGNRHMAAEAKKRAAAEK